MFPFFGRNQNGGPFNNPMQMIQQFNQLSSMAQMFQQLIGR